MGSVVDDTDTCDHQMWVHEMLQETESLLKTQLTTAQSYVNAAADVRGCINSL